MKVLLTSYGYDITNSYRPASQLTSKYRAHDSLGVVYTDHAGLEICVYLHIASPFSRQIAIDNAGPTSALESMGAEPTFRCHFLNIGPSYKQ